MQRYFTENINLEFNTAILKNGDFHHAKNVMRSRIGDKIIICDLAKHCFIATIEDFTKTEVICVNLHPHTVIQKPYHVDIAQALIRRERFEYMLQKATELGVDRIIPIVTKHTIIKLGDDKQQNKLQRWNLICKEASEQSHRSTVSIVDPVIAINELQIMDYDLVLIAYETETNSKSLPDILRQSYSRILVIIGPEGGFAPKEVIALQHFPQVHVVGLGPRILRSETASSYILSVLSFIYELGEIA